MTVTTFCHCLCWYVKEMCSHSVSVTFLAQHQGLHLNSRPSLFQTLSDVYWNRALVRSFELSVTVSVWSLMALWVGFCLCSIVDSFFTIRNRTVVMAFCIAICFDHTRLTNSYLLGGENWPECKVCHFPLTFKHIFIGLHLLQCGTSEIFCSWYFQISFWKCCILQNCCFYNCV